MKPVLLSRSPAGLAKRGRGSACRPVGRIRTSRRSRWRRPGRPSRTATRVVGHHQCATFRKVVEPAHFRAMPSLDDRPYQADRPLGEFWIPLRDGRRSEVRAFPYTPCNRYMFKCYQLGIRHATHAGMHHIGAADIWGKSIEEAWGMGRAPALQRDPKLAPAHHEDRGRGRVGLRRIRIRSLPSIAGAATSPT